MRTRERRDQKPTYTVIGKLMLEAVDEVLDDVLFILKAWGLVFSATI